MKQYSTNSPILFIIFNRPDTTKKVFDEIRKVKPKRLFIAGDGPRKDNQNDLLKCEETRKIINQIDWDCEVETFFRENNLGCKEAVSSAIDWFFQNVNQGIILEDDCLPASDFFRFCDLMLDRYANDSRISHITGCNLQDGIKRGESSYFFSNLSHIWGWATWRRVWENYDKNLTNFELEDANSAFSNIFDNEIILKAWLDKFDEMKKRKIDTWDYQFSFLNFFNNQLSIVPNVNLISNIGFNENATHTFNNSDLYANIPLQHLEFEILHPKFILPNKLADQKKMFYEFQVDKQLRKIKKNKQIHRKIKNYFKKLFK